MMGDHDSESDIFLMELPSDSELTKAKALLQNVASANPEDNGDDSSREDKSLAQSPEKIRRITCSLFVEETDKELSFRKKHFSDQNILNASLKCTTCSKNLTSYVVDGRDVFNHPVLKVLLCKECCSFYGDGEFSMDEDGSDKYCRWCGQGGMLYCCSACSCAFCKACIKRNLKRSVLVDIESEDWKCFVCVSKPLWELRAICLAAQEHSNNEKRRRNEDHKRNLLLLQKRYHDSPSKRDRLTRRKLRAKNQEVNSSDSDTPSRKLNLRHRKPVKNKCDTSDSDVEIVEVSKSKDKNRTSKKGSSQSESDNNSTHKVTREDKLSKVKFKLKGQINGKEADQSYSDALSKTSRRNKKTHDAYESDSDESKTLKSKQRDMLKAKEMKKKKKNKSCESDSSQSDSDQPIKKRKHRERKCKSSRQNKENGELSDKSDSDAQESSRNKHKKTHDAYQSDSDESKKLKSKQRDMLKAKEMKKKKNKSCESDSSQLDSDQPIKKRKHRERKSKSSSQIKERGELSDRSDSDAQESSRNKHKDKKAQDTSHLESGMNITQKSSKEVKHSPVKSKTGRNEKQKKHTSGESEENTEQVSKHREKHTKVQSHGKREAIPGLQEQSKSGSNEKTDRKSAKKACVWLQDHCKDIANVAELTLVRANRILAKQVNITNMTDLATVTKVVESMHRLVLLSTENLHTIDGNVKLMHERWQEKLKLNTKKLIKQEPEDTVTNNPPSGEDENLLSIGTTSANKRNEKITNSVDAGTGEMEIDESELELSKVSDETHSSMKPGLMNECENEMKNGGTAENNLDLVCERSNARINKEQTKEEDSKELQQKCSRGTAELNEKLTKVDDRNITESCDGIDKAENGTESSDIEENNMKFTHEKLVGEEGGVDVLSDLNTSKERVCVNDEAQSEKEDDLVQEIGKIDESRKILLSQSKKDSKCKEDIVKSREAGEHEENVHCVEAVCNSEIDDASTIMLEENNKTHSVSDIFSDADDNHEAMSVSGNEEESDSGATMENELNDSSTVLADGQFFNSTKKKPERNPDAQETTLAKESNVNSENIELNTACDTDTKKQNSLDSEKSSDLGSGESNDLEKEKCEPTERCDLDSENVEVIKSSDLDKGNEKMEKSIGSYNDKASELDSGTTEVCQEYDLGSETTTVDNTSDSCHDNTDGSKTNDLDKENVISQDKTLMKTCNEKNTSCMDKGEDNVTESSSKDAKNTNNETSDLGSENATVDKTSDSGNENTEVIKTNDLDKENVISQDKTLNRTSNEEITSCMDKGEDNVTGSSGKDAKNIDKETSVLDKDDANVDTSVKQSGDENVTETNNEHENIKQGSTLNTNSIDSVSRTSDVVGECGTIDEQEKMDVLPVTNVSDSALPGSNSDLNCDTAFSSTASGVDKLTLKYDSDVDETEEARDITDHLRCDSTNYTEEAMKAKEDLLAYSSDEETERCNEKMRRPRKCKENKVDNNEKDGNYSNSDSEKVKKKAKVKIGPKSRVRKSSISCSSRTDSDCSTGKRRKQKRDGIRAKRICLQEMEDYKLDEKLRVQCSVQMERLGADVFEQHYARYYSPDTEEEEKEKQIKSLVNLKSLMKFRGKEDSNSDSERSDKKKTTTTTTTTSIIKRKKKQKDEETLMDFHNMSDSDRSAELDKSDDDDDDGLETSFRKLKEELERKRDTIAKNLLLRFSTSGSDADKTEEEDEKPKKKKIKIEKEITKEEEVKKKKNKSDSDKDEKTQKDSEDEDELEAENDEEEGKTKKKNWRSDKLLHGKLSDTDTSDEERRWKAKKKREQSVEKEGDRKKQRGRVVINSDSDERFSLKSSSERSDSDFEVPAKKKRKATCNSSSENDKKSGSGSDASVKKKPKRRRIKVASDSNSDSDGEDIDSSQKTDTPNKGRKNIRRVMKDQSVGEATRRAAREEDERKKRIAEKQKLYNELYEELQAGVEKVEKLVLDFDPTTKKELVQVDREIVTKLKPHQVQGVKFMWDACFESLKQVEKTKGSGCILAHCMGLGKTFQVVTLIHTLLNHKKTKVNTVLVVCPLSTVLNWVNEFNMWLKETSADNRINVFELSKYKLHYERMYKLQDWQDSGGVMVIGYDMFRNLTNTTGKRIRKKALEVFQETLVDPGPDLIVCDEGHLLKNEDTALSKAMRKIRTLRRIVLTGTPLQNNLKEYHCMVQFVKPNLLGNRKEFLNRFVNPILNGQYEDSTSHDVKVMKRRAHVLHKMLEGSVQRFDYSVLTPFLPPKQEYVISIRLSELQIELYRYYLNNLAQGRADFKVKGAKLFADFQSLQRVWTHPRVLLMNEEKNEKLAEKKRLMESDSEGSLRDFVVDSDTTTESSGDSESSSDSDVVCMNSAGEEEKKKKKKHEVVNKWKSSTRSGKLLEANEEPNASGTEQDVDAENGEDKKSEPQTWWRQFMKGNEMETIRNSGKLMLLFSILKESEKIGDKVLVFSQSLYSLDLIEYFLNRIDSATQEGESDETLENHSGSWAFGLDYFRLDGSTSGENRNSSCKSFNREDNHRARLFLISTRAGGLGINLFAANRVIIFDASWNPSHDVQSIFRVYRFGQKKPCYIYRFLAQGTMEEKIYDRQVAKLSLSCRVVDEQQIERHYNMADLTELYCFDSELKTKRPTPILPKDRLLAELLKEHEQWIETYHEHDSLLENKHEEELNEEERQAAWEDYENEKKGRGLQVGFGLNQLPQISNISIPALREALKRENPTATEEHLQQQVQMVVKQLYEYMGKQNGANYQNAYGALQQQQYQQQLLQQEAAMAHYTSATLAGNSLSNLQPYGTNLYGNQMLPNPASHMVTAGSSSSVDSAAPYSNAPRIKVKSFSHMDKSNFGPSTSIPNPFARQPPPAHASSLGRFTTVPTVVKDKRMESLMASKSSSSNQSKVMPRGEKVVPVTLSRRKPRPGKPTVVDTIDVID